MFLQKVNLGKTVQVVSKRTGIQVSVRLIYRSSIDPKKDVFVLNGSASVVYRDSLRRNYKELA